MALLKNKVALITGAAQGIGLATARLMLQHGAKVSLADVSEKVGVATCNALQGEFGKEMVTYIPTDVTDSVQLRNMFQVTQDVFGGIDILCNNAGIADEQNWKKMIAVNMIGMMESTYLALEFMSGGRGGTVINVASMGGILPMPFAPNYCASKHGIVGFTRSMTDCLGQHGVRVNCVCPEFTDTNMVSKDLLSSLSPPAGIQQLIGSVGLLRPEQVAEAIMQLATEKSKVGAIMTVTLRRGIDFFRLPGDPQYSKKSTL